MTNTIRRPGATPVRPAPAPATPPRRDALAPRVVHQCAPVAPVHQCAPAPRDAAPVHAPGARVSIAPGHDEVTEQCTTGPCTGRVVRTWLTPRSAIVPAGRAAGRWYLVSHDGTAELVGCRPHQLSPIAGAVDDEPAGGAACPVIYEAEADLDNGHWMNVDADWSTACSYTSADLGKLANWIARCFAESLERRVRVGVQRPGHPETYEYAEALPPASTRRFA